MKLKIPPGLWGFSTCLFFITFILPEQTACLTPSDLWAPGCEFEPDTHGLPKSMREIECVLVCVLGDI